LDILKYFREKFYDRRIIRFHPKKKLQQFHVCGPFFLWQRNKKQTALKDCAWLDIVFIICLLFYLPVNPLYGQNVRN